jgi:ketosteroid isomerase-like protein
MTTIDLSQEVADKLAIMQLVHRFENAFDAGDIDAHMATWAEEMAFESPFGTYSDRNAYKEWVIGFMGQTKAMGGTRHLITNTIIDIQGEEASMFCYLIILNRQKRSIIASSTCQDSFRKIDGEWKFTGRVLHVDQDLSLLANG